MIDGTRLAAYGHGDWNDSLQPAKPDMRERLCSSWTVTLNYQTFMRAGRRLAARLATRDRAAEFEAMAATILEEFQRVLIVDDVLAGLAYFHEGGKTDHLLHPRDGITGLSYSLLPMIHAIINDMFTPQQAATHLGIIRKHLLGPDGAHLFDRPMAYHGGLQTYFQRAESASYFGREIGIMYTHAHLRYCEALARFGDAQGFFRALCQINPIAIRELVPSATPRQANCYYSSSDAAFADRYEAFADYDKVQRGEVALEGGWRVYSSGAGIGVRLIMQCFLGLRHGILRARHRSGHPAGAWTGLKVDLQPGRPSGRGRLSNPRHRPRTGIHQPQRQRARLHPRTQPVPARRRPHRHGRVHPRPNRQWRPAHHRARVISGGAFQAPGLFIGIGLAVANRRHGPLPPPGQPITPVLPEIWPVSVADPPSPAGFPRFFHPS